MDFHDKLKSKSPGDDEYTLTSEEMMAALTQEVRETEETINDEDKPVDNPE